MSRLVDTAVEILESARNAVQSGQTPSALTFLVGVEGGIRIIADSDWPLDSLQREHGARMAYRISPAQDRISVDGRDGSQTCHLEAAAPGRTARFLLNAAPSWHTFAQPKIAA